MTENEKLIENACTLFHEWFKDESHDYSEREDSDVEYFVGCMLYNRFAFSKAISTMQTMDVGIDFIMAAEEQYELAAKELELIETDDELVKLALLQEHIQASLDKYSSDRMACYLLLRLKNHIDSLAAIYNSEIDANDVDFERMSKQQNPIYK